MSGLSDADAETLWSALVDARDARRRVPNDADTWDLVAAIEPHVEAIVQRAVNEAIEPVRERAMTWNAKYEAIRNQGDDYGDALADAAVTILAILGDRQP